MTRAGRHLHGGDAGRKLMQVGALLAGVLLCGVQLPGCAHIDVSTELRVEPRPNAQPLVLGSGTQIVRRSPVAKWMQSGPELLVEIGVQQQCRELRYIPVTRTETITRRDPDHTVAWELGIGAAMAGMAAFALASPLSFGGRARDEEGELIGNNNAGYTTGGMFVGVSTLSFVAGAIDLARLRDTKRYAEAYVPELGAPVPCPEARWIPANQKLVLSTHGRQIEATTDAQGRARFRLPPTKSPDQEPDQDRDHASIKARRIRGAVIVDAQLAVQVDFVVPYDAPEAHGHHGQVFASETKGDTK